MALTDLRALRAALESAARAPAPLAPILEVLAGELRGQLAYVEATPAYTATVRSAIRARVVTLQDVIELLDTLGGGAA